MKNFWPVFSLPSRCVLRDNQIESVIFLGMDLHNIWTFGGVGELTMSKDICLSDNIVYYQ